MVKIDNWLWAWNEQVEKKKKRPTSNNNNKQIKGEQQEDTHAERVNARTTRIQNGGKKRQQPDFIF